MLNKKDLTELFNRYYYDTSVDVSYYCVNLAINGTHSCKVYKDKEESLEHRIKIPKDLRNFLSNNSWNVSKVVNASNRSGEILEALLKEGTISDRLLVIEKLSEKYDFLRAKKELLNKCSSIRISKNPISPFYRISYIIKNGILYGFKFYFRTRLVLENNNEKHSNEYFVKKLSEIETKPFQELVKTSKKIINLSNCKMHLIGIDCYSTTMSKYKLYLASPKLCDKRINSILKMYFNNEVTDHINTLQHIKNMYPLLCIQGFALTIDDHNNRGVNIYYSKYEEK